MKKILILLFAFSLCLSIRASVIIHEDPSAAEIMVPLFNSGKTISLFEFMKLTPSRYKELTGEKMNLKQRISLVFFKHHFRNSISKDGSINLQKFKEDEEDMLEFRLGWFLFGFFVVPPFGLLILLLVSLFIKRDDKWHERLKWAGIGTLAFLVTGIVVSIIIITSIEK